MPLVLMCATGWLQEFLVCPGPQRLQITDELWVGAGNQHFVRHMQRCQKLGRTFGVANMAIAHKVTDAAAQSADGTAEAKIAAGLLADTDTKIILRQDPEQLDVAQRTFGLTDTERALDLHPGQRPGPVARRRPTRPRPAPPCRVGAAARRHRPAHARRCRHRRG